MVPGRSLPGLVRHPQRPHDALGRDRRLGLGVPPAGTEQQRPHRRLRRAGWSRASTAADASRAPSTTARAPCSPRTSRASASTRPTTWSSSPTAASGSAIRATASTATTKATRRPARSARSASIGSTPASGAVSVVASDFVQPNGLAFSPDESLLYIVDTGATHVADGPHHVRRFRVGGRRHARRRRGLRHLPGRAVRRPARRRPRQRLAERRRRRALPRARRRSARQGADPGVGREPVLRRRQAQPHVHLRHDVALLGLSQHARGALTDRGSRHGTVPMRAASQAGRRVRCGRGRCRCLVRRTSAAEERKDQGKQPDALGPFADPGRAHACLHTSLQPGACTVGASRRKECALKRC